jgi:putative acetyltransferase
MKKEICTIRNASGQDAEQIRHLFYETVVSIDKSLYTEAQIEKWASFYSDHTKWVEKISKDNYLAAIDKKNKIIGFCSLQSSGCIDMLYVHGLHQNCGVASLLLHSLYTIADNMSIPKLYTNTNLVAAHFFEKNGFRTHKVSSKYIDGIHFTNVLMDKRMWLG